MPVIEMQFVTANEKMAFDRVKQLERQVDSLNGKLQKTGTSGKTAFSGMSSGAMDFAKSVVGISSGVGAALAVVNQLKKAWDEVIEKQHKANEAKTTAAEARNANIWNKAMDVKPEQYDAMVDYTKQKSGLDTVEIHKLMGTALSSKGSAPMELVKDAVAEAAKIQMASGGQIQGTDIVSAVFALNKATGSEDVEVLLGYFRQLALSFKATTAEKQSMMLKAITTGSDHVSPPSPLVVSRIKLSESGSLGPPL